MNNALLIILGSLALVACASPASNDDDESLGSSEEAQTRTCSGAHGMTKGIDVSSYQGHIDWAKVKADGVAFSYMRVDQGTFLDPKFETYWAGAKAAGVTRGPYMFVYSKADRHSAHDIVALFAEQMTKAGGYEADDLPPTLDVEESAPDLEYVVELVAEIKAQLHRRAVIYTTGSLGNAMAGKFKALPLWIARPTSDTCPTLPNGWTDWAMWQWRFGENGYPLAGITGGSDADADWFNGNKTDLKAFIAHSIE